MIFSDVLPPQQQIEYAVIREARTVHDTATLRLADYRIAAESGWIVATVTSTPDSGSAVVPGAYIEAETGRYVSPEHSEMVLTKKGNWHAVASGDANAPTSGPYAWTEPMESRARTLSPEDFYSPFAHGGTIVFQFEPHADAAQRFGACRLIFPEWAQATADSLKTSAHITELLAKLATQPQSTTEATQVVLGSNGISATLAFRSLLQQAPAFTMQAPALLKAVDTRRLSIFVYLGLTAAPMKDRAEWLKLLHQQVMETREPERLLAIAYAAFAVQLFSGQNPGNTHAARELLQALHKRVIELGIPLPENSPWPLLFRKSGIG
ncbi:MAG TPA: hypothetical protein VGV14_18450 [Rhodanobacter sp.]|nr:hypothetical protein [Rhodanobacter sp.]